MREPRVGDRVLVDITAYDAAMRVRDHRNYVGVLVAIGSRELRVRRDGSREVVPLEASPGDLVEAEPGKYWLRSTGASVATPDWIAEWTHYDELPGHAHVEIESREPPRHG